MHDSLRSPLIAPRTNTYFFGDIARNTCGALAISFLEVIGYTFVITLFTIAGDRALDQKNHHDKDRLVASSTIKMGIIICAVKNIYMGVGRNWYSDQLEGERLVLRDTSISFFLTLFLSAPATQLLSSKDKISIDELIWDQLLGMIMVCASLLAIYKAVSYGINKLSKWCFEEEDRDKYVVTINQSKYIQRENTKKVKMTGQKVEMTGVVSNLDDDKRTRAYRSY
jgi:hypothetical protein